MSDKIKITGRLIAAGRTLAGISQAEFATAAGIQAETLQQMEISGSARIQPGQDVEAVSRALAHFGIIIIDETDGAGAGVRLKFTRQDVRQLTRLEGEGGIVGSDDAP